MEPRPDIDTGQEASAGEHPATHAPLYPNGRPAGEQDARATAPEGETLGHDLALFIRTGRRPAWAVDDPSTLRLLPAHLAPYRDLARVRTPYPLCLPDEGGMAVALTTLIDEATEAIESDSDESARTVHALSQLEAALRRRIANHNGERLSASWKAATDEVVHQHRTEKRDAIRTALRDALEALPVDGPLYGCTPDVPPRLMQRHARAEHEERTRLLTDELATLKGRIDDILAVDASYRPEANRPDHLEASVGGPEVADIDFEALAHLLEEHPLGNPLPEERRARLQATRERLNTALTFLADALAEEPATSCEAALERATHRLDALVHLFRAARTARLEVENRYRPRVHDALFDQFTAADLTRDEVALCPPVLVHLHDVQNADKDGLMDLLGSRLPLKVLVTLDRACHAAPRPLGGACRFGGPARLAAMALSLGTAYVLQAPASDADGLQHGLRAGLGVDGPALFAVYLGNETHTPRLAPYLRAAAATEARALPAFTYDPSAGSDWASQFSVTNNPQVEQNWPISTVTPPTADGDEAPVELPFTLADLLACDDRFAAYFLPLTPSQWPDDMMPLGEYLTLDPEARAKHVPYGLMTSDDDEPYRVVVTDAVIDATRQALDHWRWLQELGGIHNSYAEEMLEQARAQFDEEKERALAELEEKHQADLDRATSALAEEIVANIAAGLLSVPTDAPPLPRPVPARPAEPRPAPETPSEAEAPSEPEEAPEEEDEEPLSLDEAYIETPRCTTCNECTNLNPQMFAYDENKQAYIKDPAAGPYRDLVVAAEKCPVAIIHPGKPLNPDEPGLDELLERAKPFL